MVKLDNIKQSWLNHSKNRYPREFAYFEPGYNNVIRSKTEIQNNLIATRMIEAHQNWTSCYITVYSFESWHGRPDNAIIDRIYLDLDHHTNPEYAVIDAIKLIGGLHSKYDIETTQYFSGKKGIALYIDFEPVPIAPENKKAVVKEFQHTLMEIFKLRFEEDGGTVDSNPIGDINRVSRLPNTKHQLSGLYCIPVTLEDLKDGIDHIRDLARKPRTDLSPTAHTNEVMTGYLLEIEKRVVIDREKERLMEGLDRRQRQYQPHKFGGKSKDENIANKLIAVLHNQKVGLVCLLHDLDWSRGEIVSLFMTNLSGANRKKTEDQVDSVIRGKRGRAR
jgi:hypothetical protein